MWIPPRGGRGRGPPTCGDFLHFQHPEYLHTQHLRKARAALPLYQETTLPYLREVSVPIIWREALGYNIWEENEPPGLGSPLYSRTSTPTWVWTLHPHLRGSVVGLTFPGPRRCEQLCQHKLF